MARPELGTVLDPSIPADVSECSIEDACKAITDFGSVPRVLVVNRDDYKRYPGLQDVALKFGLQTSVEQSYDDGEWAVHDLKDGDKRTTYWNMGP